MRSSLPALRIKPANLDALSKKLIRHKLKLALDESCTCGMIAAQLAPAVGITEVLLCSVVTYHA